MEPDDQGIKDGVLTPVYSMGKRAKCFCVNVLGICLDLSMSGRDIFIILDDGSSIETQS